MFCPKCGASVDDYVHFCPNCGADLIINSVTHEEGPKKDGNGGLNSVYSKKSLGVALFLSIIVPGLGHIYLGLVSRGIFTMIMSVLFLISTLAFPFGFLIALFIWVVALIDVYSKTTEYNNAVASGGQPPW